MYDAYLGDLRERSTIEIEEETLRALQVEGRSRPIGAGMAAGPAVPMGMDMHSQDDDELGVSEPAGLQGPR
jgi:hypothetical protein